ncbi:hypothetical protein JT358_00510 [Micrococcales bacterium 31B]|nr:hypothetical protein [Micrococcales bacterium 31B]
MTTPPPQYPQYPPPPPPVPAGYPGAVEPPRKRWPAWLGVLVGMVAMPLSFFLSGLLSGFVLQGGPGSSVVGSLFSALFLWPIVAGAVLMIWWRTRRFGAGLIIGNLLGYVVFLGVCIAIFASGAA